MRLTSFQYPRNLLSTLFVVNIRKIIFTACLSFFSFTESAMGIKLSNLGDDGENYRNNIYKIASLMISRLTRPWLANDYAYALSGTKSVLNEALKPVQEFTQSIIDKRRIDFLSKINTEDDKLEQNDEDENIYLRSKKKRVAMMDTLLQAQSDGLIDDEGIIEETDTFTFTGHDTTSTGMTFTLLLLAHNPEVQEKLFQEIQEVTGGENELTMDNLNKMNYMERVLKESLRIYPPVPYISRALTEDFEHGNRMKIIWL